ncbi:MAG: glycosyltransferase family 2 protein [Tabrizicola sp.]|nr:glycosyltransferase family 2 protein [Tabrizicola sp.]
MWRAYRQRTRRRHLLLRAIRHRRELTPVANRTGAIRKTDILCLMTVRNEALRLPHFLDHHRRLGVDHFLVIDNDSSDGTDLLLRDEVDVSVWRTAASYKASRFGMDWLTWLQIRHAHGHWCLTLDADEILIYPYWETRDLRALTDRLDQLGREAFGALTVDMYPAGPVSASGFRQGDDPLQSLDWFDGGNYSVQVQPKLRNLWIQGGARGRVFFSDEPRKAPTLNKIPLVRWSRRYAYLNSTHSLLPARLNEVYDVTGGESLSGVLLHTKFLPTITERSLEERQRGEHFANGAQYAAYYERLMNNPTLHCRTSTRFRGWRQMEAMGLMSRGGWL